MTTENPQTQEEPEEHRRRSRLGGCLLKGVLAASLLLAVFVVLGLAFGGDGDPGAGGGGAFNAGPAESYQRADISHLEQQHVFVVRLPDGEFIALYDKSAKQQEINSNCRVQWEANANLGGAVQPLPGFNGAFAETCEGTRGVWRADGLRAYGAGYGNLDRFSTEVDRNGDLIIDLSDRTCTRSRGVIGVPPFEERTCRDAPD
jgi:hypothetical protein